LFVAAALLALLIGGAVVAFNWRQPDRESTPVIPAAIPAVGQAEPGEATVETLFSLTPDPAGAIPYTPTEWDEATLISLKLDPGQEYSTDHPGFTCCMGINTTTVLSGAVSIVNDGTVLVYRKGADPDVPEEVAPGTTVELMPDDAAVYEHQRPMIMRNTGEGPARVLQGIFWSYNERTGELPESFLDAVIALQWTTISLNDPSNDQLVLERVTFEPGDTFRVKTREHVVYLHLLDEGILQGYGVDTEGNSDGSSVVMAFEGPTGGVGAQPQPPLYAEIEYRNEREEPVHLYLFRLTQQPATPGPA
jgi:hypothetical protein